MGVKTFDATDASLQRERIVIYGGPGTGKSRLALSVPLTDKWGEVLYFAADSGTKFLQFLSPAKRARVHVFEGQGDDAQQNFQEFCMHDWRKDFPKAKTIIIDTYTKVAEDTLQLSANTGAITAEKHYTFGNKAKGGQVIPNRGDYTALNSASKGYLNALEAFQSDYNIILVMHEDLKTNEKTQVTYGGPAHPGQGMTQIIAGAANTVIHLTREPVQVQGESMPKFRVIANTSHDGIFVAKLREANEETGNPMPRVVCDPNPVNFWIKYDALGAEKVG
jgi:hypothetical protein